MGLVLLMFQIGLEFEFRAALSAAKRSVVVISLTGLVVPFALGFITAPVVLRRSSASRRRRR